MIVRTVERTPPKPRVRWAYARPMYSDMWLVSQSWERMPPQHTWEVPTIISVSAPTWIGSEASWRGSMVEWMLEIVSPPDFTFRLCPNAFF